jgi:hypothetical protein
MGSHIGMRGFYARGAMNRKQRFLKFFGSTLASLTGLVAVISGIAGMNGGVPGSEDLIIAGISVLLGAWAYRSKKMRRLGLTESKEFRIGAEYSALFFIVVGLLFQNDLIIRIAQNPLINFVVPILAIVPYFMIRGNTVRGGIERSE